MSARDQAIEIAQPGATANRVAPPGSTHMSAVAE